MNNDANSPRQRAKALSLCIETEKAAMANKNIRTLSLTGIKQLLSEKDLSEMNLFIDKDLGVWRGAHAAFLHGMIGQPLLMPEMRIMMLKEGCGKVVLNLLPYNLHAGQLVVLVPGSVVQIEELPSMHQATALSLSPSLFSLATEGHVPRALDGRCRHFVLDLTPAEMESVDQFMNIIMKQTEECDCSNRVMLHLLSAFVWKVGEMWEKRERVISEHQTRRERVFTQFISLVNEHAALQHNLGFYADRLCLTTRYMSAEIKEISGRSAKEWIDEALVSAVKVALCHTDKPLKQIVSEMNFPNTSFFGKFFKRLTGTTPQQYRLSMR